MEKSESVGYEIKAQLARIGMTQKGLASRLCWNKDRLNRILKTPSKMTLDELEDICNMTGLTVTFGKGNK